MMAERLLTVPQIAEWLCVSPGWVRDHASGRRRPVLPSLKLGKLLRFRAADVDAFVEECRALESRRTAA
jgi:excisionase family DNA binding protein